MANNYAPATVYPEIPTSLISDAEADILSRMGFDIAAWDATTSYLYTEEGYFLELNDVLDDLEMADTRYETVFDIFQAIIARSKESEEEEDIEEIVIEGAFYCSKMRPGEFGGSLVRILEDDVQEHTTGSILEMLRDGRLA